MKDDKVYVGHIKEFCEDLIEYLYEIESFEEFKKSKLYQDAVVRKLEIIGEASTNISDELKSRHPEIEWKKIKGMRNKLIHAYFGIDYNLVWETLTREIPNLYKK
ncbi:MAG: DUF86 domain-containing protein [Epsilonproteobacteria bacterium]|nr:DUF86 domain-containing protein [Campylobacterota bacterium]